MMTLARTRGGIYSPRSTHRRPEKIRDFSRGSKKKSKWLRFRKRGKKILSLNQIYSVKPPSPSFSFSKCEVICGVFLAGFSYRSFTQLAVTGRRKNLLPPLFPYLVHTPSPKAPICVVGASCGSQAATDEDVQIGALFLYFPHFRRDKRGESEKGKRRRRRRQFSSAIRNTFSAFASLRPRFATAADAAAVSTTA